MSFGGFNWSPFDSMPFDGALDEIQIFPPSILETVLVYLDTQFGGPKYKAALPEWAVYPSLVGHLVDDISEWTLNGPSGLAKARIQLDCWDVTATGSQDLAEQVRAALEGYSGEVGPVKVANAVRLNELDMEPEQFEDGSDRWYERRTCDYLVWYYQSIP